MGDSLIVLIIKSIDNVEIHYEDNLYFIKKSSNTDTLLIRVASSRFVDINNSRKRLNISFFVHIGDTLLYNDEINGWRIDRVNKIPDKTSDAEIEYFNAYNKWRNFEAKSKIDKYTNEMISWQNKKNFHKIDEQLDSMLGMRLDFANQFTKSRQLSDVFLNAIKQEYLLNKNNSLFTKLNFFGIQSIDFYNEKYDWLVNCPNEIFDENFHFSLFAKQFIQSYISVKKIQSLRQKYELIAATNKGKLRGEVLSDVLIDHRDDRDIDVYFKIFSSHIKDSALVKLTAIRLSKNMGNRIFTKDELLLWSRDGKQLSLMDVLTDSKEEYIYIDFWASWCGPCRKEFVEADKSVSVLNKIGIRYVTISIDKSIEAWEKASDYHYLKSEDNFIMLNDFSKFDFNGLKILGVPLYIIINKKGEIITNDAPALSDNSFEIRVLDVVDNK